MFEFTDLSIDSEADERPVPPKERFVLRYLQENGGEATLRELSRQLAIDETAESTNVDNEEIQDLSVFLKHVHIPPLEQRGLIEYDTQEHVIQLQDTFLQRRSTAWDAHEKTSRWGIYYALLGVSLASVVLLHWLQIVQLPADALAGVILGTVLLLLGFAVSHQYQTKNQP